MEKNPENNGARRADDGCSSMAAVIEDEPASDFYASLVGLEPPSSGSRKRNRVLPHPEESKRGLDVRNCKRLQIPAPSLAPIVGADEGEIEANERGTGKQHADAALKSEMAQTLHRAFANPPIHQTSLSLDNSNKGYAMLSAMGWSEDGGGLGKSRQGTMLPVKTALKMDKRGLGSGTARRRGKRPGQGNAEARITHKHDDIEAAAGRKKGSEADRSHRESKAERKKRQKQEAEKASRDDRRARLMLRSDIPPEYEDLYMQLHK